MVFVMYLKTLSYTLFADDTSVFSSHRKINTLPNSRTETKFGTAKVDFYGLEVHTEKKRCKLTPYRE